MNTIYGLIKLSIDQCIPLPDIFQYIDTSTNFIKFIDGNGAIQYLNSKIGNSIPTFGPLNLTKFELIHKLISIVWYHRSNIEESLVGFREQNKQLINYLEENNRHDSIILINQICQQTEFLSWSEMKLNYIRQVLTYSLNFGLIYPQFIYAINYNQNLQNYELLPNKQLIKQLKEIGQFEKIVKQPFVPDLKLILELLTNLKNRKNNQNILEVLSKLYKSVREFKKKDQITVLLSQIVNGNKRIDNKQEKPQQGNHVIKKQIKQSLIKLYLYHAVRMKIPIPDIISFISSRNQSAQGKYLCICAPMKLMENRFYKHPAFAELNQSLNIDDYIFKKDKNYQQLVEFCSQIQIEQQIDVEEYILKMLELVYDNIESLRDKLVELCNDSRTQQIFNEFIALKVSKVAYPTTYFKSGDLLLKIKQFIEIQDTDFVIDLDEETISNTKSYRARVKIFRTNQLKLFKVLIMLGSPHPPFLRCLQIHKNGINYPYNRYTKICFRAGSSVLYYSLNNPDIYKVLQQITESIKGKKLSQSEVKRCFQQEIFPEKLLGFDTQSLTGMDALLRLIVMCYENRVQLKEELKSILRTKEVIEMEKYLNIEPSVRSKSKFEKTKQYLQDLIKFVFNDEDINKVQEIEEDIYVI